MAIKPHTLQGEGAVASFASAALLVTIPSNAKVPAQATFKHMGTTGYWFVQFQRDTIGSGPTSTVYSRKLSPGEEFTEDDPPTGEVWSLQTGTPDANISYYVSHS